jgi:hypothetical protein
LRWRECYVMGYHIALIYYVYHFIALFDILKHVIV